MEVIHYTGAAKEVNWQGVGFKECEEFHGFLTNDVANRVSDQELQEELNSHLKGLASTGFESENLNSILSEEIPEERDWAIGEAVAEVWLSNKYGIIWPWNTERDKKTPFASLPGADLVGFIEENGKYYFALGEVKSSTDSNTPPNVLYGKSGMVNQLEGLAAEKSLLLQLIKWLYPRCKNTDFQDQFDAAFKTLIQSEHTDLKLFGILIRDTSPNELDLKNRASALSKTVGAPMSCSLAALYLPCEIKDLPARISYGGAP